MIAACRLAQSKLLEPHWLMQSVVEWLTVRLRPAYWLYVSTASVCLVALRSGAVVVLSLCTFYWVYSSVYGRIASNFYVGIYLCYIYLYLSLKR